MCRDLFEAARTAMQRSHSPYSHFPVGAAVRGGDGRIYSGANIENAAYPEGLCAEAVAIAAMVMAGETRIVEAVVIAEKKALCSPCGGCRQKLAEFAAAGTRIWLCDAEGPQQPMTMDELLPGAFLSTDLPPVA